MTHETDKFLSKAFYTIFLLILGVILYSFIRACLLSVAPRYAPPRPPWHNWGGGGGEGPGGGGGGWGPGFTPGQPPPPYSKDPTSTRTPGGGLGGFWTGLAAGGAAGYLAAGRSQPEVRQRTVHRNCDYDQGDREVGPSRGGGGGGMRRATGFGGTTTR